MDKEQVIKVLETLLKDLKKEPLRVTRKSTIILDYGHGGAFVDKMGNVVYTTEPAKMFVHPEGKFHQQTLGGKASNTFYEGVYNREQGKAIKKELQAAGFDVIELVDGYTDVSLFERSEKVNRLCKNLTNPILVSIHSNASDSHKAEGFSIYTTKGLTESDTVAEEILKAVIAEEIGMKIRLNSHKPKHRDFEANFWILRKTMCKAILLEIGFFDTAKDANFIDNPNNQKEFAEAITKGLIEYDKL